MRTTLLSLAATCLLPLSAAAQMARPIPDEFLPDASPAIKNAVRMLANGEGAEAYPVLASNAELGNLNALFLVGFCLENGYGTPPDLEKAMEYYQKAADEEHAAAQYGLGVLRLRTAENEEQAKLAVSWIERAARNDILPARRQLARIYLEGKIGIARPKEGIAQLQRGVERGDAESHYLLAQAYEIGAGFDEPKLEKAFEHYAEAARGGHTPSLVYMGLGHQAGQLLKKDLEEAFNYFRRADELGDPVGTYHLANAYADGSGTTKDEAVAHDLYQKAADGGHIGGLVALAEAKLEGKGCEMDEAASFELYKKAAQAGSGEAMIRLSVNYRNGEGGAGQDHDQADYWMLTAGKIGFPPAANALGVMYRKGGRFPKDEIAAAAWFVRAAEGGFAAAMVNLGDMFERGIALPTSFGTAGVWYQRAAEAGHPVGMYQMARLVEQGAGTEPDPYKAYVLFGMAAQLGHGPSERERIRIGKELRPSQVLEGNREIEKGLEPFKES